jgi:hypothetical protein
MKNPSSEPRSVEQLREALSDENFIRELETKYWVHYSCTYFFVVEDMPGKEGMKQVIFLKRGSENERVPLEFVAENWGRCIVKKS